MSLTATAVRGTMPGLARDNASVRGLEVRLRETRHSVIVQKVAAGVCWLSVALAVGLAGMAIIDYFAELATAWRAVWFVASITAVCVAGFQAWRRTIAHYTLYRAAADAEGHLAQFGQRLRTTLDYEHPEPRPAEASP